MAIALGKKRVEVRSPPLIFDGNIASRTTCLPNNSEAAINPRRCPSRRSHMKIDIPDMLYQSYAETVKNRPHYFGSVDESIQHLIELELRRLAAPGYGTDGLTRCKTHHQLKFDLTEALMRNSGKEPGLLSTQYLCMDIDDFRHYLCDHGPGQGDEVLVDIANQLIEKYTAADVYRFGGDEFVVHLGSREYLPIDPPSEIRLKHSIVDVVAQTTHSRFHHLHSLIMLYIHRGVVESEEPGKKIVFRYPDAA
jgi:diguanylate cyclase (GGDEF)-like protein